MEITAMNEEPVPNKTPQQQFREDVLPPYRDYMNDMGCQWKAKAAGNAVAHFAEHVWVYYKHHDVTKLQGAGSAEEYVEDLAAKCGGCPELRIIWDFALSVKHRILDPKRKKRIIPLATSVFEELEERLWMPDCGRYYDEVLEKAVSFLKGYLPNS